IPTTVKVSIRILSQCEINFGVVVDLTQIPTVNHPNVLAVTFCSLLTFSAHATAVRNGLQNRNMAFKALSGSTSGMDKETYKTVVRSPIAGIEHQAQRLLVPHSQCIEQFPDYKVPGAQHQDFSPYESNGGSIVAIAGDDYVVIAADTRLSSGYSIHTRKQNKLFQLSPKTVLGSTGCWCDTLALTALVKARMQMYEHTHLKTMSTDANVETGLDNEGKGVVYSYDPIGHCERTTYRAGGSAGALLQPVLDNQIGFKNMKLEGGVVPKVPKERAVAIATDTFISAAERDIYTGDAVMINIITKDGIEVKEVQLRKD
ncbi:Proteasome subunit beta type-1, partial [Lucilia cuprina]